MMEFNVYSLNIIVIQIINFTTLNINKANNTYDYVFYILQIFNYHPL